jgi:hypothetical protein
MTENGFAIRRDPCLRCEDRELCGICELNLLRQKEQTLKRAEYKKTEEIQMRNENENQAMKCECTEACNCTPCNTEACNCTPCNPYEATVPLMLSADYKDRFVAEYRQTKIRYERLDAHCNRIEAAVRNPEKVDMPPHDCDLELLREQQSAMGHYLHVLKVRAELEHIEL